MAQSKQAMQNTIKNLQAKSDHISKLQDKGTKSLVLQFGSHTIKMGFANQKVPFTISPFIAYRKTMPQKKSQNQKNQQILDYEWFKSQYYKIQEKLKTEGTIASDNKTFKGKPRAKQVLGVQKLPNLPQYSQVLCGDQALLVQNDPNYIFRKVIKYGYLNIDSEQEFKNSINDLQNLMIYMLNKKLKIPQKQWSSFSCVVIVPDIFIRLHVKHLVYSLFAAIGFKKIYLHLQSVMACFGTAVSSSCVVDIGHQKISVCCVDEGIIVPQTLIRKNYGMKHISKCLARIFNDKINDKEVGQLNSLKEADIQQIDKIKQLACVIKQPEESINRKKNQVVSVQITYTDSVCVLANSIFSQMWNSFETTQKQKDFFNLHSECFDLYEDPDDYFQQYSGGGHIYQMNLQNSEDTDPKIFDPWLYQSIEELIISSLRSIKEKDLRKKYLSSILIVGGGAHMSKLPEQILNRLNFAIQHSAQFQEQKAQLSTDLFLRQIAPIHASWLGGTVIPKLDSLRDLWIQRNKFLGEIGAQVEQEEDQAAFDRKLFTRKEQSQQWGLIYLKQKIPFIW